MSLPLSCRTCFFAVATAVASLIGPDVLGQSSPQVTSWYTAQSGKYARIVETDGELSTNATKTTWTRTSGPNTTTQALPVYAGPQQIDYSASFVYIRTPNLGTYTMGPWYNNAARTQLFVNIPKNQGIIYRIPRTSTIPTTKTRTQGLQVGGVLQDAIGMCVDGVAIFDPLDGYSYSNGTESMGGNGDWRRDAYVNEGITFDKSLAHQQNTGKYHNHANPIALRYQLGDNVVYNSTTKAYSEGDTYAPAAHSPIIGWMLDGLPVYGPYGYSSAMDATSSIRRMKSGFVLRDGATTGVDNISVAGRTVPLWSTRNGGGSAAGPAVSATYPVGRYIEDWAYLGDLIKSGSTYYQQGTDFDLNEYNVRYCKTPEFPSGTWAYFLNITSTGAPQFPYMVNRWLFGTPTGGAVSTVNETVTNHFMGGANRLLSITNVNVIGTNVSLTWNAVEGATYSVDASTNATTWTSKATGLTVSNANTRSHTHTALSTSGSEYARVNRTAIATYDTTGTTTATVAQTTSSAFTVGTPPTLTTINTLTGATEDTPFTISYATLAAAADEADVDGNAISFRVEAVGNGALTKNGGAVVAGTTLLSSGESLVWTPATNANGTLAAFTVRAFDGNLASASGVAVNVIVTAAANLAQWDGGAGTAGWGTGQNWLSDVVPDSIDYLSFTGITPLSISLGIDRQAAALAFSGESAYTLQGNTLALLSGGGITTASPSASSVTHTLSSALLLTNSATFSTASNAHLTISNVSGSSSVNKTGAGTLTFSGTHDRQGNTMITGGTLSMSSASLADAWDISIATGATLDLNFAGSDTVHALYLNGVATRIGTWGGLSSSATNKDSRLSGTGILNVTSGLTTLASWASVHNLSGDDALETADPDHDGVGNRLEFVLGTDPSESDSASRKPVGAILGGYFTFTFYRNDESENDSTLIVEYGTNLSSWTQAVIGSSSSTADGGVIINVEENGAAADLVTVQVPLGTEGRMFGRLSVIGN